MFRSIRPLLVPTALCLFLPTVPGPLAAADDAVGPTASDLAGLAFRSIGPALTSGRISDIAVDPTEPNRWVVGVASGNVWQTENRGLVWDPIFDSEGSYSIGAVTIDPHDPDTIWVGTGENNAQRSVAWGDGLYRSRDRGASWTRVGLERSEHIAKIVVDPRDPDVVWVAAQGPLWSAGGDRGLYTSTDGGDTWSVSLGVDEHTGVTDLSLDPRNPDVIVAASWQRRRHVFTLVDGGPGSGIHRSDDGGATWREITSGLPTVDIGRIGLARSPADPDLLYAIVEAARDEGGFFRSTDGGESWEKRGDHVAGSPQYYQELVADPVDPDRVYSLETFLHVTEDGGATFRHAGERYKHVDNHALWIDPRDPRHLLVGHDGGLSESWDRADHWDFKANLPVTQFYKIAVDSQVPFYRVYGGTQDNFTLGGPARTRFVHGSSNGDWSSVTTGDGFQPRVDPTDPHIVYAQAQYGSLVRYDRRTGVEVSIQPLEEPGDDPLRWNWDSPLLVSPHSPTRLYFAAQRVFRSEDRGDSWTPVGDDLTRALDRNGIPVMGRIQSIDAVAKNASTSPYGNIVALDESPLVEGLLYAGTDDGLVRILEPGAESWRTVERLPGVPEHAYVSRVTASLHDPDTVFVAANHHKTGDFRPYLLRSDDRGRTWTSLASDLPESSPIWAVLQDHLEPGLLFVGTEHGVWCSVDAGSHWFELTGGVPTIAVRDLAIHRKMDDLVLGTFGRGFYVLDDYSPLRAWTASVDGEARIFAPRDAWLYAEASPLGYGSDHFFGSGFFMAPNPPFGAVVTYRLEEGFPSRTEARREREDEIEDGDVPVPSWDELRAEDREIAPQVVLTVRDADGTVVRRIDAPASEGLHRVAWDLRSPPADPVDLSPPGPRVPWSSDPIGPFALPGRYTVELAVRVDGETRPLAAPVAFEVVALDDGSLPPPDRNELLAFQKRTAELQRTALGASAALGEIEETLPYLRRAVFDTPAADLGLLDRIDAIRAAALDLRERLSGDRTVASRNEPTPMSLLDRVLAVVYGHWSTTGGATGTQRRAVEIAEADLAPVLTELRRLADEELPAVERELERHGAPWTPGRLPGSSAPAGASR